MKLYIYIALVIAFFLSKGEAKAEVLALDYKSNVQDLLYPLLQEYSRKQEIPRNQVEYQKLVQQIDEDRKSLLNTKQSSFYAKRIASALFLKIAYWSKSDEALAKANYEKASREFLDFSSTALQFVKEPLARDEILFQEGLAYYVKSPAQADISFKKLVTTKFKSSDLVAYLSRLYLIRQRKTKVSTDDEARASRLGKRASVVLSLAKAEARDLSINSLRSELLFVSRLCQDFSSSDKEILFQQTLKLWISHSSFAQQWEPLPFQVSCYQQTKYFPALLERLADFAAKSGLSDKAATYLQSAIEKTPGEREQAELGLKLAQVNKVQYNSLRDALAYQAKLILLEKKFHGLPQGIRLIQMHDELLSREIDLGHGSQSKSQGELKQLFQRYVEDNAYSPASRKIRAKWVDYLVAKGEFPEAIAQLQTLAKGSIGIVKESYARRAIELQSKIWSWNTNEPWTLPKSRAMSELARLSELYDMLPAMAKQNSDYQIIKAQLSEQLGQRSEAVARFEVALNLSRERSDQNLIFTQLVLFALQRGDAQAIIRYAETGLKKSYNLTEKLPAGQSLKDLYRSTLYQLAKDRYTRSQWADCRQTIDKTLPILNRVEERNELLFLKAKSYQSQEMYPESLETLDKLVASEAKDGFWEQGILEKASILLGQGQLNETAKVYEAYLVSSRSKDRLSEVELGLASIYATLGRYQESRVLVKRRLDEIDSDEDAIELGATLVDLHKHLNLQKDLEADLSYLKGKGDSMKSALAQLLNLGVRRYALSFDPKSYFQTEDYKLSSVRDLLSESAYRSAQKIVRMEFESLAQKLRSEQGLDLVILKQSYSKTSEAFVKACEWPGSRYCALALSELGDVSKRFDEYGQSLSLGPAQKTALSTFFALETNALEGQIRDATSRGNLDLDWLANRSRLEESLWRFLGLKIETDQTRLDLPSLITKESNLNYSQGVTP